MLVVALMQRPRIRCEEEGQEEESEKKEKNEEEEETGKESIKECKYNVHEWDPNRCLHRITISFVDKSSHTETMSPSTPVVQSGAF